MAVEQFDDSRSENPLSQNPDLIPDGEVSLDQVELSTSRKVEDLSSAQRQTRRAAESEEGSSMVEDTFKAFGLDENEGKALGAVDRADNSVDEMFGKKGSANSPCNLAVWQGKFPTELFGIKPEETAPQIQEKIDAFVDLVKNHKENGSLYEENGKIRQAVLDQLAEAGYWGMLVPAEFGGVGATFSDAAKMITKMAAVDGSIAGLASIHGCIGAVDPITHFASPEMKAEFLPTLASGERVSAFALTEPGAGSDLTAIQTTAVDDGDELVINGRKLFISNASEGKTLGLVLKYQGKPNVVIVDLPEEQNENFQIERYGIHALRRIENVGLVFKDFRVSKDNLLFVPGPEGEQMLGKGLAIAYHGLNRGRVALNANAGGVMRSMLSDVLPWAEKRMTFGKEIGERELVQRRLGNMAALIAGSDALTEWCSALLDNGYRGELECIVAKVFGSEAQKEAAIEYYMKTHGGRSFLEGHPFGDNIHDFLAPCIYEGEGEMLSMAFFNALVKDHGMKYFQPMNERIKEGLREGKFDKFDTKNPKHAWWVKKEIGKLGTWIVPNSVRNTFRGLGEKLGMRHPVRDGDLDGDLKKMADYAASRLQDKAGEINNLMLTYQAGLADKQTLVQDVSMETQKLVTMVVTAMWGADQEDPVNRKAAEAMCLKLKSEVDGKKPGRKLNKLLIELGQHVRDGEFSLIDDVDPAAIVQDY